MSVICLLYSISALRSSHELQVSFSELFFDFASSVRALTFSCSADNFSIPKKVQDVVLTQANIRDSCFFSFLFSASSSAIRALAFFAAWHLQNSHANNSTCVSVRR